MSIDQQSESILPPGKTDLNKNKYIALGILAVIVVGYMFFSGKDITGQWSADYGYGKGVITFESNHDYKFSKNGREIVSGKWKVKENNGDKQIIEVGDSSSSMEILVEFLSNDKISLIMGGVTLIMDRKK
jgi:hypothetical protein